MKLKKCENCNSYSLKEICKKCKSKTLARALKTYDADNIKTIKDYISFLEKNEYIFDTIIHCIYSFTNSYTVDVACQ